MATMMNANPFDIDDLRGKILEERSEQMKKDYIRKIYPEWKKDELSGELHSDSIKITGTRERLCVKWTLLPDSSNSVDTTHLLVTTPYEDHLYMEPYYTVVDESHLMLRDVERLWKHKPDYDEDDNDYEDMGIDYYSECYAMHNMLSKREINRRNEIFGMNWYDQTFHSDDIQPV